MVLRLLLPRSLAVRRVLVCLLKHWEPALASYLASSPFLLPTSFARRDVLSPLGAGPILAKAYYPRLLSIVTLPSTKMPLTGGVEPRFPSAVRPKPVLGKRALISNASLKSSSLATGTAPYIFTGDSNYNWCALTVSSRGTPPFAGLAVLIGFALATTPRSRLLFSLAFALGLAVGPGTPIG